MSPKQQLNQILEGGFDSVVDTGVRAFTVESLAKRLAMSKKTIYKFFPTKENLIRSIMQFVFTQIDGAFNKVMVDEPNPAVQFIKIMETIAKFAGRVPVDKIAELKSLHPEIWKEIESFRLSHQDDFYTILHDAQEQGIGCKAGNRLGIGLAAVDLHSFEAGKVDRERVALHHHLGIVAAQVR